MIKIRSLRTPELETKIMPCPERWLHLLNVSCASAALGSAVGHQIPRSQ